MLIEEINNDLYGNTAPGPGVMLIANPFLKDPHFLRSVIFLCEHKPEGSFGFMVNKLFHQPLNELIPDTFTLPLDVYFGGPVQMDTIHFLHQYPDLIEGSVKVRQGIYWGGNFEQTVVLLNTGQIDKRRIKFFLGYSGWSAGQLVNELKEESWIVSKSKKGLLFASKQDDLWSRSLKSMGKDFAVMANYPIDPSLN